MREAAGMHETSGDYLQLTDMSPQHVFDLRLETTGAGDEAGLLRETFNEALQLMEEGS
jgi:hypothetical protein